MSMVTNDQPSLLLTNEKSTFVGLFDSLFTFLKYKKEEEEMHFFAGGTTDLVANIQLPESTSNDQVVTEWSPMKSYKWVFFSWKEDNNVLLFDL